MIDEKQCTVPLYFGFAGDCVCNLTLTVSNGCPTKTPAAPGKQNIGTNVDYVAVLEKLQ